MINLIEEKIIEIADNLDCGFKCFVNIKNGEIISYPDEFRNIGIELENWEKEINELENNYDDYLEINFMEYRDSFILMEDFIEQLDDYKIRQKFNYALSRPKPFKNFNYEIDYNPEIRELWFDFKRIQMISWVKNQIDEFNTKLQ